MCRADISVTTYSWLSTCNYQLPWPVFELKHPCRNWATIDEWPAKRAIHIHDLTLVIHPQVGTLHYYPFTNLESILEGKELLLKICSRTIIRRTVLESDSQLGSTNSSEISYPYCQKLTVALWMAVIEKIMHQYTRGSISRICKYISPAAIPWN